MAKIDYKSGSVSSDGHTFLIVADETKEFSNALRYASHIAKARNAHIAVLFVMGNNDFVNWGKVEERMRQEQREEAEKFLREVAGRVEDVDGVIPILYLEEGDRIEAVLKVLRENPDITKLVLGADTKIGTPGPLVTYFTSKGLAQVSVPVIIVPDHIPPEKIDATA
ncbi:MAG: universal stress protein [Alphaproteobacteria bacterium]|nr:universal stress protein [Alphaproteobacteria bacterium]